MESSRFRFTLVQLFIVTAFVGCLLVLPNTYGCGHPQPWKFISTLAFSPNGETLAAEMYDGVLVNRNLKFYDVDAYQSVFLVPTTKTERPLKMERTFIGTGHISLRAPKPTRIVFSPDSKTLAFATCGGELFMRNTSNNRNKELPIILTARVESLDWSADSLVVGYHGGFAELRDLRSGKTTPISCDANIVALSASGDRCILASEFGHVEFWDITAAPQCLDRLTLANTRIRDVASSANGAAVVIACDDGIVVWDLATGKTEKVDQLEGVNGIAYSPDGRALAMGGPDGVAIVDVTTGQWGRVDLEHEWTSCVAFSPEGQRLVTAHANARIIVWDVQTRRPVRTLSLRGKCRVPVVVPLTAMLILGCLFWYTRGTRHSCRAEPPSP